MLLPVFVSLLRLISDEDRGGRPRPRLALEEPHEFARSAARRRIFADEIIEGPPPIV
jgi:hypothetical protein